MSGKLIAVDFDGTCVEHRFPEIGRDIGAETVLKKLIDAGHSIMLWTMRSGKGLEDALQWFADRNIPLLCANSNSRQTWTTFPKMYAHLYIDDAALGCPLIDSGLEGERPYVDWVIVDQYLISMGMY